MTSISQFETSLIQDNKGRNQQISPSNMVGSFNNQNTDTSYKGN